jgi:hypothetical protein
LTLTDAELRAVVDDLVTSELLLRDGHRVSLPDRGAALDPIMRERVERLMSALRDSGSAPPPVERVAARLGIPAALVGQLRAAGELVAVAAAIDYPRDTWAEISQRLDRLAANSVLSVRLVRDELGTTRRHAEAILHRRLSANRDTRGVE